MIFVAFLLSWTTMKRISLFFLFASTVIASEAQYRHQPASGEIRLRLKKLASLGSVLYIAAHPDDENTLAIGYYANERSMTTAYLSLTRGDGGQNLIGGELRDKLGLIRTQELLAARRVDGGIQYFTRANDFGFSKGPEETLKIWDKEAVLRDVLKVVRSFKPDIIICRFPPDSRAGHGHHTSSALLALEAYEKSDDPSVFPDQVAQYGIWKPRRVFLNVSRFFNSSINEKTPGIITIDMGGYNPLLGVSYPELSATSRSMHKSQGFGSRARRGYTPEFFELQKGDSVRTDLLEGINTSWSRVQDGKKIEALILPLQEKFSDEQPWLIVPDLIKIKKQISSLPPGIWKDRKLVEVNSLILDCLGLYAEVTADHYNQSPGKFADFSVEVQNRSKAEVTLVNFFMPELKNDSLLNKKISGGGQVVFNFKKLLPVSLNFSPPYWLKDKHGTGLFTVTNPDLIGLPENPAALTVKFFFRINEEILEYIVPVLYKSTDPVRGEVYRPVEITPPVSVEPKQAVELFPDQKTKVIHVDVRALASGTQKGSLKVKVPDGWRVSPEQIPLNLMKRGAFETHLFEVTPPAFPGESNLQISALIDGKDYQSAVEEIAYDHIPVQTLQFSSEIRLIRSDIRFSSGRVGYVQGAGDEIAESLRSIGVDVTELKDSEITALSLQSFDAVILGIRAVNANPEIASILPALNSYCNAGGVVIMQYNTTGDLAVEKFSPFPLTISRERVTEEQSPVKILEPSHPAMSFPNKITENDFNGWVQERGLYFPGKWDPAYTALLSMNDTNEPERKGSLLTARYGKGWFVYTGISFFRQLPEGVSGAYRLMANLISLKNAPK